MSERLNRLYEVNTVAGWAKNRLRILIEILEEKHIPNKNEQRNNWILNNLKEIYEDLITAGDVPDDIYQGWIREDAYKADMRLKEEKIEKLGRHIERLKYQKRVLLDKLDWIEGQAMDHGHYYLISKVEFDSTMNGR